MIFRILVFSHLLVALASEPPASATRPPCAQAGLEQVVARVSPRQVTLFEQYAQFPEDYETRLLALGPGDEVRFSNGARFTLQGLRRRTAEWLEWGLAGGRSLMVPSRAGSTRLDEWMSGYHRLRHWNIATVEVFPQLSNPPEYITLASLPPDTRTWADFVRNYALLSESDRAAGLAAWDRFLKSTAHLATFGLDQPPSLVFHDGEWRLSEWGVGVERILKLEAPAATEFFLRPPGRDPAVDVEVVRQARQANPDRWAPYRYRVTWLNPRFLGEDLGKTIYSRRRGRYSEFLVEYVSADSIDENRVVFQNGRMLRANGTPLDTTFSGTIEVSQGRAIFVMDGHGNFYVLDHQEGGRVLTQLASLASHNKTGYREV